MYRPRRYDSFVPLRLWIFWLLFLVRGAFYCTMLPVWEGWDEYAHVAFLQHWNETHRLPIAGDRVSPEIDASLRRHLLPRELHWIGPPYRTRETASAPIAGTPVPYPFVFYEAQQPPLYYWIAAPLFRGSVEHGVFIVRLFSVLLASLAIPFTWLAAPRFAPGCAALLAVAPGLAIDVAHVANDALAIGIASVFLWLMSSTKERRMVTGIVLGAALLTKASLLVLLPVVIVLRKRQALVPVLIALAVGGWWYIRNLILGLPFSGWQESVGLSALAASAVQLARSGRWINGAQTIAKSFTWFGAWSFLTLRTWMYLSLEAVAGSGMVCALMAKKPGIRVPLVFSICFTLAIAAGEAAYNSVHGIAGIPGWYLWPVGGAMSILVAAGLGRFVWIFATMLAAADIFGVTARMMPYYAGLAPWNRGSVLQVGDAARLLHVPVWLIALWIAATLAVPALLCQGRAKTRT